MLAFNKALQDVAVIREYPGNFSRDVGRRTKKKDRNSVFGH